jgi:hemolysin activation/secretion protein
MVKLKVGLFVAALVGSACTASPLYAQVAAPSTVTPPTLAPPQPQNTVAVEVPEAGAIAPPPGAEGLSVTLGSVEVEGGFAEVSRESQAIVARLQGHPVTLAQVYAAASDIEAAHARAGYVLARVSVPPQQLRDGGALRIVVTDGFIDRVDVSRLPARVQPPVAARPGHAGGLVQLCDQLSRRRSEDRSAANPGPQRLQWPLAFG